MKTRFEFSPDMWIDERLLQIQAIANPTSQSQQVTTTTQAGTQATGVGAGATVQSVNSGGGALTLNEESPAAIAALQSTVQAGSQLAETALSYEATLAAKAQDTAAQTTQSPVQQYGTVALVGLGIVVIGGVVYSVWGKK